MRRVGIKLGSLVFAGLLASVGAVAWSALGGEASRQAGSAVAGDCRTYTGLPSGFGEDPRAGMLQVPAGIVELGSASGHPEEAPTGERIKVAAFWMDRTEVTNAQFTAFVNATGYITDAEREDAGAVLRVPSKKDAAVRADGSWWVWLRGANWRTPQGPESSVRPQPNEPVVLVTYQDAMAYARWLGRDLPTEAEWEYAARGGGTGELIDREPRDPKGRPIANYWQGVFPDMNTKEDGYVALAPVGCFPRNGLGFVDMVGNVWELTRDKYAGPHQFHGADPTVVTDQSHPRRGERMVIKGGSYLCAESYCARYRVTARHPQESDLATVHVGFRTVLRGQSTASAKLTRP